MIETERIILRPTEREDVILIVKWLNKPAVRNTLLLPVPVSVAQMEKWFEDIIQDKSREDFIMVDKETNIPIGYAGFVHIDRFHSKAEPTVTIGEEKFWGKGYGSEITRKLLDFGFNELGLNRQYGFVMENNPGSLKMCLRAGFKEEGLLKQNFLHHGKYSDVIMIGVTREEFNKNKKE